MPATCGMYCDAQVDGADYLALLRRGGQAVSVASLDCFGKEACRVDLLATRGAARGQGNARALITSLESYLAQSGAAQQLLAVVDAGGLALEQSSSIEGGRGRMPAPGAELWQRGLGYRRLTRNQIRQLQSKYPILSYHAETSAFYSKPLPLAKASSRHKQAAREGSAEAALAGAIGVGAGKLLQSKSDKGNGQKHQEQQQTQSKRRHSNWRFRLWGWAARKVVRGVTFGLVDI
jgi:GNAT superfamily N-acetyltransferase